MHIWLFPGTFDPITLGHETTIRRASKLCDSLIVCVIDNYNKKPIFSTDDRVSMINKVCEDIPNVKVVYVPNITAEYAQSIGANVILRGLRSAYEFESELILANYYNNMYPDVETIFLPSSRSKRDFSSSSLLKDVAFHNGELSSIINHRILDIVKNRFMQMKEEEI